MEILKRIETHLLYEPSKLPKDNKESLAEIIKESLILKSNAFGLGFDLKIFFSKVIKKLKENKKDR